MHACIYAYVYIHIDIYIYIHTCIYICLCAMQSYFQICAGCTLLLWVSWKEAPSHSTTSTACTVVLAYGASTQHTQFLQPARQVPSS